MYHLYSYIAKLLDLTVFVKTDHTMRWLHIVYQLHVNYSLFSSLSMGFLHHQVENQNISRFACYFVFVLLNTYFTFNQVIFLKIYNFTSILQFICYNNFKNSCIHNNIIVFIISYHAIKYHDIDIYRHVMQLWSRSNVKSVKFKNFLGHTP